jgi:HAD superfamily hydrolase (TIGR01450 family)
VDNTQAVEKLLNVECFLLDMDGTIYLENTLIDGALDFLHAIKRSGRRFLFVTNNSSRSTLEYCNKLSRLGIEASENEIFSSTKATIEYLTSVKKISRIYLLATPGIEEEFHQAGFVLTDNMPQAVVLAFDTTINYQKIKTASSLLLQDIPFVATHPDLVCPTEQYPLPDCGAIIEMFRSATGREPTVIGKPSAFMADMAINLLGVKADKAAIVGDRIYTDMKMAQDSGLTGILVLSGEAKSADLEKVDIAYDLVFNSVKDMLPFLIGQ